jgi:RNA polymerase sigma-B factor
MPSHPAARVQPVGPNRGLRLDELDLRVLFVRLRERDDPRARDEIFRRFQPLARRLAFRYRRPYTSLDDITQVANLGLMSAIVHFDPRRGATFRAYAIPTILGELKRHFRDTGWAAHVPRRAQELALRVDRAIDDLTAAHRCSPRVDEIAQYLGLGTEEVLCALSARRSHYSVSLEQPSQRDDEGSYEHALGDALGELDERYALVDMKLFLASALPQLPFAQRRALSLRINENLIQSEIAARIGCSQMQVSRLLRDGASRIQAMMARDL